MSRSYTRCLCAGVRRDGDNLAIPSEKCPGKRGTSFTSHDNLHKKAGTDNKPFGFRYRIFTNLLQQDDDRRIIAGTVESVLFRLGSGSVFTIGEASVITSVEGFNSPQSTIYQRYSAGVTLRMNCMLSGRNHVQTRSTPSVVSSVSELMYSGWEPRRWYRIKSIN